MEPTDSTDRSRLTGRTIAVVIPTFRRPKLLQALLGSLREGSRIPDEVIVVDNDPERSAYPEPVPGLVVRVVHVGLGLNLAGARNAGWRSADSDLCVFIDDDNVVERDAIFELARPFDSTRIGFAGPVIYAGDTGTVWCGGIRRSGWTGVTRCRLRGRSVLPAATTWHTDDMPDAFAVPRPVLEAVNGFDDERFPIHYDEADLAVRIRELGLRTIVVRDARVRHYGWVGISPGQAIVQAVTLHSAGRARQMALSRVRFHMLHSQGLQRLSSAGVFIPVWMIVTMTACLLADGPWADRIATVRAVGAGTLAGYREALSGPRKARA
jgi:GT2 family glycosyltransferase